MQKQEVLKDIWRMCSIGIQKQKKNMVKKMFRLITFFMFKNHFEEMYNKGYDDGAEDRKKYPSLYNQIPNADYVKGYDDGARWAKEMCLTEFARMNNPFK